ncbi:MAG: hypothetical protein ABIG96_03585 [Candidatus Micrarchaeota archaeon]
MVWKKFLKPTFGKILLTLFFMLAPIPLPPAVAATMNAKYVPIITFPFVKTSTIYAYLVIVLSAVCFYLLSCVISDLYHKHVVRDARQLERVE